jgi:hypothetical protein
MEFRFPIYPSIFNSRTIADNKAGPASQKCGSCKPYEYENESRQGRFMEINHAQRSIEKCSATDFSLDRSGLPRRFATFRRYFV